MMKLYRSRRDSKLTGLCGGLAETMNVDPTILRLVTVVTAFFSGGTVIPIYIIAAIVIPKEPVLNVPPMYGTPAGAYPGGTGGSYRPQPHSYYPNQSASYPPNTGAAGTTTASYGQPQQQAANLDEMMKDVEKKALYKELEELRAKVAKYEKGE